MVDEDLELIADLFYRVGIWVSHCDDTDYGERSEDLEKKQMVRAFSRIEKISRFPFIKQAAHAALHGRKIPHAETEERITDDIKRVVFLLKSHEDLDGLQEFKKAIMYIGTAVARAYREEVDHHEDEFLLQTFIDRLMGNLNKVNSPEDFKNLNISPAEDNALTMISEALRVKA